MRFLVEWRLFLLAGVGGLAGAWVAVSAQRRRHVVRFTNVELLDVIAPERPRWRRHVPAALFLVASAALVLGLGEPVRAVRVPKERATIVLAVDVSPSMAAEDVAPSRLVAAQQAARDFVDDLPDQLTVSLVTFSGSTAVAVPATDDHRSVIDAIDGLTLGWGTAIGEAIFTSLDAVAAAPSGEDGEPAPARVVLMSDGATTQGRPNGEGAAAAAAAGMPVDTISFGTPHGTIESEFGGPEPAPAEPGPLAEIATATGGRAFEAQSLDELAAAYADIATVIGYDDVERDVSGWFVGAGVAFLAVAAALNLTWSQRLP